MHSLCLFIIISLNFKKILDIFKKKDIIVLLQNFGELCNGSTTDSDSVCWGSNPYTPAKIKRYHPIGWCLFVLVKFIIGIRTRREQSLIAEENSPVDCFRRRGQRAYARRQVRQHRKKPYSPAKNPVHASGRDFYFLLLTYSLLPH